MSNASLAFAADIAAQEISHRLPWARAEESVERGLRVSDPGAAPSPIAGPAGLRIAYLPEGAVRPSRRDAGSHMALDLWEQSSEDVRERWRDIARMLREGGDAEALPRALQTAFWFGADAARRATTLARFEMTLRDLLPPERVVGLKSPPSSDTGTSGRTR